MHAVVAPVIVSLYLPTSQVRQAAPVVARYCPAAQAVHADEPAVAYSPFLQVKHTSLYAPSLLPFDLYSPASQAVHVPGAVVVQPELYCPAAHFMLDLSQSVVLAVSVLNLPAVHTVQSVAPVVLLDVGAAAYLPATQSSHAVFSPTAELCWPAGHFLHAAPVDSWYIPTPQPVQSACASLTPPATYCPLGQDLHVDCIA